jgi:uncharacterized protein YbaP (TraB family)
MAAWLAAIVGLVSASATVARAEPPIYVARGAHATIYFLGTFHALKAGFTWDQRRLDRVFDRLAANSGQVWTEIGESIDSSEVRNLTESLGFDATRRLEDMVSGPDIASLRDVFARNGVPPDAARLNTMRPWLAWVTASALLVQQDGFRAENGVEAVITTKAHARRLPIRGFETVAEQIRILAGLSNDTAEVLLHVALSDPADSLRRDDALARAWAAGDEAAIVNSAAEIKLESGESYSHLLADRNQLWAARLAQQLGASGTWLVAVGELHLAGDDSVLALLRARGFSVVRLTGDEP